MNFRTVLNICTAAALPKLLQIVGFCVLSTDLHGRPLDFQGKRAQHVQWSSMDVQATLYSLTVYEGSCKTRRKAT